MSTYLLAVFVGKFDYIEMNTKNGVLVRAYTPEGKSQLAELQTKIVVESIDLYEQFFSVPYPLPKLDILSLHYFSMSAMENWGCIIFAS